MRKGSVCIAQYYASLLPPTLQRAKPGDVFVYGQSGACNSAEGTVITDHRDHQHHHHYHHHRCRRRRRPALPSQPHTSALATGSIATGDEERGGYVCLCGCAVGFVSESVCVCRSKGHSPTVCFRGTANHRLHVTYRHCRLVCSGGVEFPLLDRCVGCRRV